MRIKTHSAFTLVETMVTVLLFAMILGGIYSTIMIGNASWQNYEAAVMVQQEARRATAFMARDFRMAQHLRIDSSTGGLIVTFSHPQDGEVRYSWLQQDNGAAGHLMRQTASGTVIIGRNISSFVVSEAKDAIAFSVVAVRTSRQGKELTFKLEHRVGKR